MNNRNVERSQTEEEKLFFDAIADEAIERAGNTQREIAENITWAFCPSGLTICRV